jgi:hypothetical protein
VPARSAISETIANTSMLPHARHIYYQGSVAAQKRPSVQHKEQVLQTPTDCDPKR